MIVKGHRKKIRWPFMFISTRQTKQNITTKLDKIIQLIHVLYM